MNRRFLKIQNYRNIGVTKDLEEYQTLYLNNTLNKDEMGELIILIGKTMLVNQIYWMLLIL